MILLLVVGEETSCPVVCRYYMHNETDKRASLPTEARDTRQIEFEEVNFPKWKWLMTLVEEERNNSQRTQKMPEI